MSLNYLSRIVNVRKNDGATSFVTAAQAIGKVLVINGEEYSFRAAIGEGSYGRVDRFSTQNDAKSVAVKHVKGNFCFKYESGPSGHSEARSCDPDLLTLEGESPLSDPATPVEQLYEFDLTKLSDLYVTAMLQRPNKNDSSWENIVDAQVYGNKLKFSRKDSRGNELSMSVNTPSNLRHEGPMLKIPMDDFIALFPDGKLESCKVEFEYVIVMDHLTPAANLGASAFEGETNIFNALWEVFNALYFMVTVMGLVYVDMKIQNLLLTKQGKLVLGDLGSFSPIQEASGISTYPIPYVTHTDKSRIRPSENNHLGGFIMFLAYAGMVSKTNSDHISFMMNGLENNGHYEKNLQSKLTERFERIYSKDDLVVPIKSGFSEYPYSSIHALSMVIFMQGLLARLSPDRMDAAKVDELKSRKAHHVEIIAGYLNKRRRTTY